MFPETDAANSAPSADALPNNVSAKLLPSSSNPFSTISSESSLAFSVDYAAASDFIASMQEISAPEAAAESHGSKAAGTHESKKWIMKAARVASTPGGVRSWVQESWTSFVDLLKVCCLHTTLEPSFGANATTER